MKKLSLIILIVSLFTRPNAISRLRYHQFYAPKIVERILKSAPPGADLKSWRY